MLHVRVVLDHIVSFGCLNFCLIIWLLQTLFLFKLLAQYLIFCRISVISLTLCILFRSIFCIYFATCIFVRYCVYFVCNIGMILALFLANHQTTFDKLQKSCLVLQTKN